MAKFGKPKLSEEEKQARAEKKKQEQEKKQAEKAEQIKNRKINFFIMRYMWQVVRGRSGEDTIYRCFGMSRERYTRIIDTGKVRYRTSELDELTRLTGIPRTIFTGEERYSCLDKQGREVISQEEWDAFVELRKERRGLNLGTSSDASVEDRKAYDDANEKYKIAEQSIGKRLQQIPRKGDTSFHRLCTFFKNGFGSKLERFQDVKQALTFIEFNLLNECSKAELDGLYKMLTQKAKMVSAVSLYRGARGDFKKN